ncbi:MAG: chemotaxis protein CheW [Acidobacteriota bacterium]|nr:MAG: chemotaxis protein CheW [Acidobacteriota bacterium]
MPASSRSFDSSPPVLSGSSEGVFLWFEGGGERYAAPVAEASEICELENLRAVPGAASPVNGIMDLRGRIVTVIDLFFRPSPERPEKPNGSNGATLKNQVLVFHEPYLHLGLRLPSEVGTFRHPKAKILEDFSASEERAGDKRAPWIRGVLEHEGRLYNILSGERVAAYARLRIVESFKR